MNTDEISLRRAICAVCSSRASIVVELSFPELRGKRIYARSTADRFHAANATAADPTMNVAQKSSSIASPTADVDWTCLSRTLVPCGDDEWTVWAGAGEDRP